MSIVLFGKGDQIALPKPGNMGDCISLDTFFTHPTLDRHYSPYGFAFPLDNQGVPLNLLLDNRLPLQYAKMKPVKLDYQFLLIDLQGQLWKVLVLPDDEGNLNTSSHAIIPSDDSWWITCRSVVDKPISSDVSLLTGFLYTNPTIDKINKFWFTYMLTGQLQWVSIKEITQTLSDKFLDILIK